MNILHELNSLIKSSKYLKALKILLKYDYQDSTILCIKVSRRYSYVCNKLLNKYLLKYDKKSHKVKPILYRAIEALHQWSYYLQKEDTRHMVFTPKRLSCISPKAQAINHSTKRNNKWLFNQKRLFVHQLQDTLKYYYQYLKLRKEPTALLVLKKYVTVSYFCDFHYRLHQNSIIKRQEMLMLIGSAYFEINSMQMSIDHLELSIILGLEKIVAPLLYLKEQLRISQDDSKFQFQLQQSVSNVVACLYLLAHAFEIKGDISKSVNCISFCNFLTSVLTFFEKCAELQVCVVLQYGQKQQNYGEHLQEVGELVRFANFLTDHVSEPQPSEPAPQSIYQSLIERIQILDIPNVIVRQDPVVETEESKGYHKKTNSEITDTTIHSGRPSKTGTDILFVNDSNGLTSISLFQQQPEILNYKQFKKNKQQRTVANHYLAKLLQMRGKNNLNEYDLLTHRTNNNSSFKTLEEAINQVIDTRLPMNHVSYENSSLQCNRLIKQEFELKKEFPFAYDMLKFKQEFGSGLCILEENVQEFNKHFEFNVLKYFDYLTQNKESAMSNLKYNQNFSKLRLAEQKLISSRNLVLKKQVESFKQEKEEEKKQENENETQANLLFQNVEKRKTMLYSILGASDTSMQNSQGNQKLNKSILKFRSQNPTPKNLSPVNQSILNIVKDKILIQQNFFKAQQTIKTHLLDSEFLIQKKQVVKHQSEPSENLLMRMNEDLANSVKHLKAAGMQQFVVKKQKTIHFREKKMTFKQQ